MGGLVIIDRALGMPLDGEHEVIGGSAFQRFDDAIVGAASGDAKALADCLGGLMMRRIHGNDEFVFFSIHDFCKPGVIFYLDCMRDCDLLACCVIDARAQCFRQEVRDVLDERTAAVNVEALEAIADAENRLAQVLGIVQQQGVDGVAAGVGGGSARGTGRAELRRIDIGVAAGQEHAVAALDDLHEFG